MNSTVSNFIFIQAILFRFGLGHHNMNLKNNLIAGIFDLCFVYVE